MLAKVQEPLNTDAANEISAFAAYYHSFAAQEISEVITSFIRDVSFAFVAQVDADSLFPFLMP